MENNSYTIVDEPKNRAFESYIVDPTMILLVSIFIPVLWTPPAFGRFWIPIVWLLANGYFLGSSTWKKELATGFAGVGMLLAAFFGLVFYSLQESTVYTSEQIGPYFQIFLNAILFLTLYVIAFMQSRSFELFEYMREDD